MDTRVLKNASQIIDNLDDEVIEFLQDSTDALPETTRVNLNLVIEGIEFYKTHVLDIREQYEEAKADGDSPRQAFLKTLTFFSGRVMEATEQYSERAVSVTDSSLAIEPILEDFIEECVTVAIRAKAACDHASPCRAEYY